MTARLGTSGGAFDSASAAAASGGSSAPMTRAASCLRGVSSKDALLLLDDLLSLVAVLFSAYQRCGEIDGLEHDARVEHYRTFAAPPTAAEKALVDKHVAFSDRNWARLKGTVREPVE
jgi:hypothetical protein